MPRSTQIHEAYAAIKAEAEAGDERLTASGRVRVEALQARAGLEDITAAERDAAAESIGHGAAPGAGAQPAGERDLLLAKAAKLSLRLAEIEGAEDWSIEKLREAVDEAEARERQRIATDARLSRAAKARAAAENAVIPMARVRITKAGDGRISCGQHIAGQGDLTYEKGEIADVPQTAAMAFEGRGWAEIV
jgi:hypothetical protein